MFKKKCTLIVLSMIFLLSISKALAAQPIKLESATALRIIGIAAAIGGVTSLTHKKGRKLAGCFLFTLGTTFAIGADRILEELNRHVIKTGWFNQLERNFKHIFKESTT